MCRQQHLRQVVTLVMALAMSSCVTAAKDETLYQRLGAGNGIETLVKQLVINIAGDERIRDHFQSIHIAGFRERLEDHFCKITDGPCEYTGRSMSDSHQLLGIDDAAFNALVEDLIDAMEHLQIPYATQNAFLERLIPLQKDIVAENL